MGSLKNKMIFLSVGILALYYVLVSLFSIIFMEPYYLHQVQQNLISAYDRLRQEGEYQLSTISELEETNISLIIADAETLELLYCTPQMPKRFMERIQLDFLPYVRDQAEKTETGYHINSDELYQQTASGATVFDGRRVTLGGITEYYVVDLSTSYAFVSQATTISVQFSLVVGLMVMIMAAMVFSKMSSLVTEPVTQITHIAGKIAHLDFSQKCRTDLGGEIGLMADSVNTMSDMMQEHISQLQAANQQLKEDIRLREEQEKARKDLVANLSHDLKTPIGLISGYADGLRSGMVKTDKEIKEYCDVICDESDRMMAMILRMMELFRLESGTVSLEKEPFDLADLLNYLVEIFSNEMQRAGIQFTSEYKDGLFVFSDYFAVEQVLTNYMQNAVSHMGEGKQLRLWVEEKEETYRICIFNSAAAIPTEQQGRIWDGFYRLDKSRSQRASGLGLSIVRSNMELLGGEYGMENTEGGVIFWAEFSKSRDEKDE